MPLSPDDVVEIRDERIAAAPSAEELYVTSTSYVNHHRLWKDRIRALDNVVNDIAPLLASNSVPADKRWQTFYIANSIKGDLHDVGMLVGDPKPTVVRDPADEGDKAQEDATLVQQVLAHYRRRSRLDRQRRLLAMDLAGAAAACWVIWPDLQEPDPTRAFPLYIRKDPRYVFPDPAWTGGDDLANMVITFRQKARTVETAYPGTLAKLFTADELMEASNAEFDIVEFYDPSISMKVAVFAGRLKGKDQHRATEIASLPNLVGRPLVVMGSRLAFDGQFRGQFDAAIAPLSAANAMFNMHLDQLADMIYSEKEVHGQWENAQDVGPGATLFTNDPGAKIIRTPPAGSHPQMFADIQLLREQAREAAAVPQARQGEISQNIASAAFVTAVQGKLATQVGDYQLALADMEERANSLALAVDEKYLDANEKPISGTAAGRHFSTKYTPSVAIKGNYDNRVVYGEGQGLDRMNRKIAILQDKNSGLISERRARIEGTEVEDVLAEERQIYREAFEKSVVAGMVLPDTPIHMRLQALDMLEEGKSMKEIAKMLLEQPEPVVGPAPTPAEPATELRALQRGGQPGSAEKLPRQAPLPPLPELLGRT
jgi:hypothetical protein